MMDITAATLVSLVLVPCHECRKPVSQGDAHTIRLLEPSGRVRDGHPVWRTTNQTIYECDSCFEKHPDDVA